MLGVVTKKALLQSAPWAVVALLAYVLAWVPAWRMPESQRRQVRLLALPTAAVLGAFALAGVQRHDGLAFNQRYFLELLPLAAVTFAWALDGLALRIRAVTIGAALGIVAVLTTLIRTPAAGGPDTALWMARQIVVLKAPLLCAVSLALLWIWRSRERVPTILLSGAVGLCLGWGLALHLAQDVTASHWVRGAKLARTEALARLLPDRSAFLAYKGSKDAAAPLLFDRDIVILDVRADEGRDAPALIGELFGQGRRVFLLEDGFPSHVLARVLSQVQTRTVSAEGIHLLELSRSPLHSSSVAD